MKRKAEAAGSGVKPKKATKQPLKVFRDGVGKYLNLPDLSTDKKNQDVPTKKAKKDKKCDFGHFDSW